MAKFTVAGPFDVPTTRAVCRIMDSDKIKEAWSSQWNYYAKRKGVYVFGIRTSGGATPIPIYVGKATKNFRQECFTDHKIVKLMKVCATYKRGVPIIFFVCHPTQKGKTNNREITEIESELMNLGYNRNKNIQNEKGIFKPTWSIQGVIRSSKGKTVAGAKVLKATLGLK